MGIVVNSRYERTHQALMKDPIIIAMADEIPKGHEVANGDSVSADLNWQFIRAALDTYHRRGGKIETHIGGPSTAIRRLVEARDK
jgi:hypothetical protein